MCTTYIFNRLQRLRFTTIQILVGVFYNHTKLSRYKTNQVKPEQNEGFTTIQILAGVKPQIIILHICMVLASDINTLIYFKQNAFTSTSSPLGRKIALAYYKICILFLFLINEII